MVNYQNFKRLSQEERIFLDFEIAFYEGLIKGKPDFVWALTALGEAYTKAGLYEQGLKIDRKLVTLKPEDPIAHYNLACSLALLNKKPAALDTLKNAIQLGYEDIEHMHKDADLNNIRQERRYQKLYQGLRKKISSRQKSITT